MLTFLLGAGSAWLPAAAPLWPDPSAQERIEQALPDRALARPRQPRQLLIFTLNVGYGGHGSIAHANQAFSRMGQKTGAYETVISQDPAVFAPENLRHFDAVFFNNNVGNLFTNSEWRRSLVEFVYGGGGLLGVHGTSVAFTQWPGAIEDWPEFGLMIGARGANHRESDEHVFIQLDDPAHPLNRVFGGKGFDYRDEFFRVHEPYSRGRLRILLSIDTNLTDLNQGPPRGNCERADNDYALAWIRGYGRGRVFYSTIAHNPYVFWDAKLLEFYLGAVQFALGDLEAPTTPSARLTPAIQARENLGWRLSLMPGSAQDLTLFEAIDQAAQHGLLHLHARATQRVSPDAAQPFHDQLSDEEQRQIRFKLDRAGVRLLTWAVPPLPHDPTAADSLFAFARNMGIETILSDCPPQQWPQLDQLAEKHHLNVALPTRDPAAGLEQLKPYGPRLGLDLNLTTLTRTIPDPARAVRLLGDRLLVARINTAGDPEKAWLAEAAQAGLRPLLLGLETAPAALTPTREWIDQACLAADSRGAD